MKQSLQHIIQTVFSDDHMKIVLGVQHQISTIVCIAFLHDYIYDNIIPDTVRTAVWVTVQLPVRDSVKDILVSLK